MTVTACIDVGSTYTKVIIQSDDGSILGRAAAPTGFRLREKARETYDKALAAADVPESEIQYVIATGIGRHQVDFKDLHVTDLTASARGANFLFPQTQTILDIGGQTMKASRIDEVAKVVSFRLNDKCAAGTGAFLEKTARYMGFETTEIGPLMSTSKTKIDSVLKIPTLNRLPGRLSPLKNTTAGPWTSNGQKMASAGDCISYRLDRRPFAAGRARESNATS